MNKMIKPSLHKLAILANPVKIHQTCQYYHLGKYQNVPICQTSIHICNYLLFFKVQSNLSTTTTLGTPKKWPLCTGGCSVEVFQSKLV